MATVQTIATTLTADPKPFVQGIREFDREVGRAFSRLDQMNKRAFPSEGAGGGGGAGGFADIRRQSDNATRGLLELSRGVEDAAVSFSLTGFQGAVRGSLNNLSQMAMIMGGPLAGAMAGFAAAGASIAAPWIASLFDAGDEAKRFAEQLDIINKKLKEQLDKRIANREAEIDFRNERQGFDNPDDVNASIKKREDELEKNRARQREIEEARLRNYGNTSLGDTLPLSAYGATLEEQERAIKRRQQADAYDNELARERNSLLRREIELQVQLGLLEGDRRKQKEKEQERQRQQLGSDAQEIVRGFQEADQREAEQEQERQERQQQQNEERNRRKEISDNERLQDMLRGRIRGLGGNVDPLEGIDIPDPAAKLREEEKRNKKRQEELVEESWSPDVTDERIREIHRELLEIRNRNTEIIEEWGKLREKAPVADRLRGVLGEIDEFNNRKPGQLAGVATAGSQSLLRAQYVSKDAAEAKQQRDRLIKRLEDLLNEIKGLRKDEKDKDEDDVGLT